MKYDKLAQNVPQTEPMDDRQVKNNAGGYVFTVTDWDRLDRFLILGSDAPTYYQNAGPLTRENARCVERCYDLDAERTVNRIVEVSQTGRAPKNDPAIFALAIGAAHSDVKVRRLALDNLSSVCRTSTHLFSFVNAAKALGRGWGRTLKRAVADWYDRKTPDELAYQVIKYRSREGWRHNDVLKVAHPKGDKTTGDGPKDSIYRWVLDKELKGGTHPLISAHLMAMSETTQKRDLLKLIEEHSLPWEAIPTHVKTDPDVWKVMIPFMGMTALIRNLGSMTAYGTLKPLSKELETVCTRLTAERELHKSRIHPFTILQALAVYQNGGGSYYGGFSRGRAPRQTLSWQPIRDISDALDTAFYKAFQNIEPTNKRTLIGLDVSGSMTSPFGGSPLSVREAAAAMCMATVRTEPYTHIIGFTGSRRGFSMRRDGDPDAVTVLDISPKHRLDTVVERTSRLNFGPTDCALPMIYAQKNKLDVETFIVYTDNETWCGSTHPMQALRSYRKASGNHAKLVVVGMTSTGFSIADPQDGGCLDVVGFDSAAPQVIADFTR